MAFDWVPEEDRALLEEYLKRRVTPGYGVEDMKAAQDADKREAGIAAIGSSGRRVSELITGVPNRDPGYQPQNMRNWLAQRQVAAGEDAGANEDKRALLKAYLAEKMKGREAETEAGLRRTEAERTEGVAAATRAEQLAGQLARDKENDERTAAEKKLDRESAERIAHERASATDPLHQSLLTDRTQRATERQETQDAKRFIGEGYTPATTPLPPPVQADLQKRAAATEVVLDNAKSLEKLLTEGGPAVWGQRAGEMEMLANNIWTELKDIKGLGVLAGPDMGLLQGILADPTKLRTLLRDATGMKALLPLVQKFQQRMVDDMDKRVGNYGAKRKPPAPPVGAQPNPDDAKALEWVKANPNDPRAAAIGAKLKAKGLL